MSVPDLSVIVVSHGHEALLAACLGSLGRALDGLATEVILVDNLGAGSLAAAGSGLPFPIRALVNPEPLGLAQNTNQAARAAGGAYLLLLNPDTEIRAGSLRDAVAFLGARADVGLLGCRLSNPDGSFQQSYRRFPTVPVVLARGFAADRWPYRPRFYRRGLMEAERLEVPAPVDWVLGAFMLMRRSDFVAVGGMDEGYRLYYEDVDLCYRLRQRSLATYYWPHLDVLHAWKRTSAASPLGRHWLWHVRSSWRYFRKHGYVLRTGAETA